MSGRKRVLIVCPGRGSYGRNSLGYLKDRPQPQLDALRSARGRPTITELDSAEQFRSRLHLAGEHASLLTYACSTADSGDLDPERYEVVGVTGNSLGFYTALAVAGALPHDQAAELIETMGELQIDNIIGGQLLYPIWDEDWKPSAEYEAAIERAIAKVEATGARAEWSIRLGGTAVLGADETGLRILEAELPKVQRGERSFPLRLPLHSAFHTSLMAETSAKAKAALAHLEFQAPADVNIPLIDGRGYVHRPGWADPVALREYTLGAQITETYDFSAALHSALNHCAPDMVVCLGPGNALGGPVAQLLVAAGWRGIDSKEKLARAQEADPVLAAFGVPDQAAILRA